MAFVVVATLLLAIGDVFAAYAYDTYLNLRPGDPVGFLRVDIPLFAGALACLLGVLTAASGFLVQSIRSRGYARWILVALIVSHGVPLLCFLIWVRVTL